MSRWPRPQTSSHSRENSGQRSKGSPTRTSRTRFPDFVGILAIETDAQVVAETVVALGQAWEPQAAQLILDHVRVDHANTEVPARRCPVAAQGRRTRHPLSRRRYRGAHHVDQRRGLRRPELGLLRTRTGGRRLARGKYALAARLTDPDDDTRCEALLALAKTGDSRAGTLPRKASGAPGIW